MKQTTLVRQSLSKMLF